VHLLAVVTQITQRSDDISQKAFWVGCRLMVIFPLGDQIQQMKHQPTLLKPLHLYNTNCALSGHLDRAKNICQTKGDTPTAPHVSRHKMHLPHLIGRNNVSSLNTKAAPPPLGLPGLLPTRKVLTEQRCTVRGTPPVHTAGRRTLQNTQRALLTMCSAESRILSLQLRNTLTKSYTLTARAAVRRPNRGKMGLQGRHLKHHGLQCLVAPVITVSTTGKGLRRAVARASK
jgi:hypothetical protein